MSESVPYFPAKFSLYLKKLAGFKKQVVKFYPLNRSSFKSGGESISFDLPAGIIDPSTFAIHCLATGTNATNAATSALPDNVESFFNRYSVSAGGSLVNPACQNTSLLANGLLGLACGDDIRKSTRGVLQNGLSADAVVGPTKHLWMNQFYGLLGVNHYLDTGLFGIRIELITESGNCLSAQTAGNTCSFELSDVYAICEVIELEGEAKAIYDMAMTSKMKNGGIVIPFKNWTGISERVTSSSGSVKFSVASQCLNKLVVIPQATDARTATKTQGTEADGNRSKFFYSTKGSLKEWYIQLAGRNTINVSGDEMSFLMAQQALGQQKDVSTGSLITAANYLSGRFIIVHSFEYVGDGALDRSVLGLDTRMSPNGYFNMIGDGGNTNIDVNLYAETTSTLRVLAPGVIQVEA